MEESKEQRVDRYVSAMEEFARGNREELPMRIEFGDDISDEDVSDGISRWEMKAQRMTDHN